jgi:hypothetical protein
MAIKPNISGIIQSIIWLWAFCCGSVTLGVTIFCDSHMVTPTRTATPMLGETRLNQRKLLSKGKTEYTTGHDQSRCDRPSKSSGVTARTFMIDW